MRLFVVACCAVHSATQYPLPYDDGAYDGLDDLDSDPGYLIGDDDAIGQPAGYYSRSCLFAPPGTGVQFDLSGMQANDHDYTGTTTGGYVYRFNICGNTNKVCTDKAAPASKWRGTKCNNLGDADTMKVSLLDAKQPSKGVRFSYAQGDICKKQNEIGLTEMGSRSITFEVSCDASAAGQGTLREIQEISMCEYKVLFDSRFACPVASTRGSAWSMLLLCVLAVCAYCGIGYAYNHYYLALQGLEAIPNRQMWEELPTLVREGLSFSLVQSKVGIEMARERAGPTFESMREQAGPWISSTVETVKEKLRGKVPGI